MKTLSKDAKAKRLVAIATDLLEMKIFRATQAGLYNTSIKVSHVPARVERGIALSFAKQGYDIKLGDNTVTVDWRNVCLAH